MHFLIYYVHVNFLCVICVLCVDGDEVDFDAGALQGLGRVSTSGI